MINVEVARRKNNRFVYCSVQGYYLLGKRYFAFGAIAKKTKSLIP